MKFLADYHTHTQYSHGQGTVLDNARVAHRKGLSTVAITDHGPANLFGVGVRTVEVFARIRREAEAAEALLPGLRVLVGAEANVIAADGSIDIPAEVLADLDILLVGLHVLIRPRSWSEYARIALPNLLVHQERFRRRAVVANTDALVNAVNRYPVHTVTHPGYRLPIDSAVLARACARRGVALELNTSHAQTTPEYLRIAVAEGARLVVSSDAHTPDRVGDLIGGALLLARAGIPSDAVLNAAGSRS